MAATDKKQYIEKADKRQLLVLMHRISQEMESGTNEWIIANCEEFNPEENNHFSAFEAYVRQQYPPGCEARKNCNQKPITKAQLTSWVTAHRAYAKRMNKKFAGTPGWGDGVPQIAYLRDSMTDEQRKAKLQAARLEKEKSDAISFMEMLKG